MPSFNQGKFIRQAVDSILNQNYRPLELLIIDGCSTDNTLQVLAEYERFPEVRIISETDDGPVDAVNKGMELAKGDILAIQSSDDAYLPNAIEDVVSTFEDHPEVALVYSDVLRVDAENKVRTATDIKHGPLRYHLSKQMWIPQPTCFFRAKVIEEIGMWDKSIPYVPDIDYWLKIRFRYPIMKVNRIWGLLRDHQDQRNTQSGRIINDWRKMISQSSDIRNSDVRTRLAARSGSHTTAYRYGTGSAVLDSYHIIASFLLWPQTLRYLKQVWFRLVPGLQKIMWHYAKKRTLKRPGNASNSTPAPPTLNEFLESLDSSRLPRAD